MPPPSLLHATDGDLHLVGSGRKQDAGVEDAVLLRSDQLLSVKQQDHLVSRARDQQLGNTAAFADLGHGEGSRLDGISAENIVDWRLPVAPQGDDREVEVADGVAHYERGDERSQDMRCLLCWHGVLLWLGPVPPGPLAWMPEGASPRCKLPGIIAPSGR